MTLQQKDYALVVRVMDEVMAECQRARRKHPPLNSTHEAYGVIKEEFEEWWDSVKADTPDDKELISVAAMAVLAVVELQGQNRRPTGNGDGPQEAS